MLDPTSAADILSESIQAANAMFAANRGMPLDDSIAAREVADFDRKLADITGLPRPVFGAYADAEVKLRALNDLVRSATLLLPRADTSVGATTVLRSALETSARLYWILATDSDYQERAARWLRERLRVIGEVRKLNPSDRGLFDKMERDVRDGAAHAGLNMPGPPPNAVELVTDLLSRPGVLCLGGLERTDIAAIFYRLPSASVHSAAHRIVMHHPGTDGDSNRRVTTSEPWEYGMVMVGGVFAAFANANEALAKLYGWDCTEWAATTSASARLIANALDSRREAEVRS